MGIIALEGLQFYAFHGFYEAEQLIGGYYTVDVYLEVDFNAAAQKDELDGTINYETVYRVIKLEMQKKTKLIEALGQRIINRLKGLFENLKAVRLRIYKKNPPIGAKVEHSYVELSESYQVQCNKCKKNFLSHFPGDYWTKNGELYPETKSILSRTFGPVICPKCLKDYLIPERPETVD